MSFPIISSRTPGLPLAASLESATRWLRHLNSHGPRANGFYSGSPSSGSPFHQRNAQRPALMCIKTDVPAPHRLDLSAHRTWMHRSEGGRNTHSSMEQEHHRACRQCPLHHLSLSWSGVATTALVVRSVADRGEQDADGLCCTISFRQDREDCAIPVRN